VNTSLELSFIKPGMISYPAKAYAGDLVYDSIGLPTEKILEKFDFRYNMIDSAWVAENLPKRENNSHKGTFGKLLVITGSEKYRGAAHLSLEAALRGGAGLVTYAGPQTLISELSAKYPEAIYKNVGNIDGASDETIEELISLSAKHSATLIGSGSSNSERLADLVLALLRSEGGALILDADAINALSDRREVALAALRESKRPVLLTPHPLEFARLSGTDVASVQLHRLEASEKFAKENGVTLILKGAGTVVTDGDEVYINVLGSSALAKAGSGDVLAGLVASLMAQGSASPAVLSSLAVYFHAQAGERLAERLSAYGVTPSDLPLEICKCIASVLN
jgi:NAD(P)H-hydrate epimerase